MNIYVVLFVVNFCINFSSYALYVEQKESTKAPVNLFHRAVASGNIERVTEYLTKHRLSLLEKSKALNIAFSMINETERIKSLINLLVQHQADVNIADQNGNRPLDRCVFQLLAVAGAFIKINDFYHIPLTGSLLYDSKKLKICPIMEFLSKYERAIIVPLNISLAVQKDLALSGVHLDVGNKSHYKESMNNWTSLYTVLKTNGATLSCPFKSHDCTKQNSPKTLSYF